MDINIERAKDAGVAISDIFNTMQVLWWIVYNGFQQVGNNTE
jgi:hypothetical protein